jgi:hypothetical protein
MIRAFIDVFPNSVLLSGAQADLLLIGTTDSRIEIDPARVVAALSVSGPIERLTRHPGRLHATAVTVAAQKLTNALRLAK